MSAVFTRGDDLPVAVKAEGCWVIDADGRRYLDAAGGAVVSAIGHGRARVVEAIAARLSQVDFVHSTTFRTEAIETYAHEVAELVPMQGARIYPVAGGSEAIETALKLARATQVARGEGHRVTFLSRRGSYHGNTLGALDVSGRMRLRGPYEPLLGRAVFVPEVNEFRCPVPTHPDECGARHAERLEEEIVKRGDVVAFIGESVGGATMGATVPPPDYWKAVAEACHRHGVLLIVDEVMAGFGRTGRWFGIQHWGIEPDILVAGKGAASGYWPLGLCIASDEVFATVSEAGFIHGFTFSHHGAGAAAGLEVLKIMQEEGLVEAATRQGQKLRAGLEAMLGDHPHVGDIRGIGLLLAVEFVADRATRQAFPATRGVTDLVVKAARAEGLLLYPVRGGADGINGDAVLLGPPLSISDEEVSQVVERSLTALDRVWS
jgi:adenosylmethionine-8-amino-7-oxononanoate aminotransferase